MAKDRAYAFRRRLEDGLAKFRNGKESFKSASKMRVFMRQTYDGPAFLTENRENWCTDPEDAYNFSMASQEHLAETYTRHSRKEEHVYFAFVDVVVEHRFQAVPMDSPEMLDAIRERALNKLSKVEVAALGAESLAIYYKLKNHNVDDEDGQ
jgi:hypothetical protein